jgi:hypothetical protein
MADGGRDFGAVRWVAGQGLNRLEIQVGRVFVSAASAIILRRVRYYFGRYYFGWLGNNWKSDFQHLLFNSLRHAGFFYSFRHVSFFYSFTHALKSKTTGTILDVPGES